MFKNPLDYRNEDLHEIMHKLIRIEVGPSSSNQITEVIAGTIYECLMATNEPHLPVKANIITSKGDLRSFDFFEIKRFSSIE